MDDRSRNRLVGAWLAALVCALGATVLAGWYLHAPVLLQLDPSWVPMQYNTAFCFVALGLGLLALASDFRGAAPVLGAIPLLVGGVTLVTSVFDLQPGIDELFFRHYITIFTSSPGRMSPNTAFSFILAGAALVLTARRLPATHLGISWTLGLFVCVCGMAAGCWTLLHSGDSPAESVRFTYMAVHTGVGLVLAGAAISVLTAHARALSKLDRLWDLPVTAGLSIVVVSLVLWQAFTVAEDRRIRSDMREAFAQVAATLEADSQLRREAYGRAIRRTAREATAAPNAAWESEAQDYFRGSKWLREITWFNPDGSIRHRVVRDPAEHLPDPSVDTRLQSSEDFRHAMHNQTIEMVRTGVQSHSSVDRLAYILAPFDSGAVSGMLVFTVRLDFLFDEAIGETARGYNIVVTDAGRPVFRRVDSPAPASSREFGVERQGIQVFWRHWLLEVEPGPEILGRLSTLLPKLTLLFGVALSLLMAVALRYAGMVRQRTAGIVNARLMIEREVDERRRAEVYARTSEERTRLALAEMRQILNQSQDLICTVDIQGRFLVISASARQMLGYGPDEMKGRRWDEFIYSEDREATEIEAAALQSGKVTRDFENRFMHRNGGLVHLSWSAAWVVETQTCYAIARDVTRRNRQNALREGQRSVLQLIATGVPLRRVLQEICEYIERIDSSAFCSVLLLEPDGERVRTMAAPRLPPEYVAAVDGSSIGPDAGSCGTAMWRRETVIAVDIEIDPLWADYRDLANAHGLKSCWAVPIVGGDHRVLGAFAIYYFESRRPEPADFEMIEAAAGLASIAIERDQVQSRLIESREQLEFARRLAQLGYWEVYVDSGRTVLSADMLEMLGMSPAAEPDFNYLMQFVLDADQPALLAARAAALKHDTPIDAEARLMLPDGSLRYVHVRGRPVRRHDGVAIKLAGTVQDITVRKKVELENARLYEELEQRVQSRTRELAQSNRELEAFSYSVSHDLRAPLRAVAGFGALLQDQHGSSMDPQGRHYLDRIIAGTVRMSALIDDLLELGRVNRIEIVRQPLDLSALATAVSSRFHERWPQRVVDVEIQPDLVAWGDLRLMEVVLENLLDNAWKFTAGRMAAKVQVGKDMQDGQEIFFVADDGVGFDLQYAANLFGVFQRLHAATAFPGTGVGLATVHRILQRHGGRIWADATIDKGATFYFTVSERSR